MIQCSLILGLAGKDDLEKAEVDSVADATNDVSSLILGIFFAENEDIKVNS